MYISRSRKKELETLEYEPVYLTEDGVKKLHEKLARLKRDLPGLISEMHRTAAYGDRSENEEYKQAKSLLLRTQGQILRIEHQIRNVRKIQPDAKKSGTVQLGSIVTISDENGLLQKFQIVGPMETNPDKKRISDKSPLGAVLLGHKKNDVVILATANGKREYTITEIV